MKEHTPPTPSPSSRRLFLKRAAAASIASPVIIPAAALARGESAPSSRINVGFIGVGRIGAAHLERYVGYRNVQVVAIADPQRSHREHHARRAEALYAQHADSDATFRGRGIAVYNDLRDLLARRDIDAVVIATPDHWHAEAAILAARAGKHIYCEKPLSLTVASGRRIVQAAAENHCVLQTGTQQRSEFAGRFRRAVELVRNGYLGELKEIHVGVGGPPRECRLPAQTPPPGVDWNLWLGPAPWRDYNVALCPALSFAGWPRWREFREFSGGGMTDWGAHHFDIVQWALDADQTGPVEILPPDGRTVKKLTFRYANGVTVHHGDANGIRFVGSDGVLEVNRNWFRTWPDRIAHVQLQSQDLHLFRSPGHHKNWLDCIRSGQTPISPAEAGQRSATVCHLGNITYQLNRPLRWNPHTERFAADTEANDLLDRPSRDFWPEA